MEIFSRLLHEKSKNLYSPETKKEDPSTWPDEWKTTFYKEYLRFPATELGFDLADQQDPILQAIASRKSDRDMSGGGLSLKQLSLLLKYSCGEFKKTDRINRAQPSGGARYPIEVYVLLFKGEGIEPGIYHYNVKHHRLERMWDGGEAFSDTAKLMNGEWTKNASALIVTTGVFWRNQNKYKSRGYRMICCEAGAIIQNLYLIAGQIGLKCTALSGTNDDQIEKMLDLDTEVESLVMSAVIGT